MQRAEASTRAVARNGGHIHDVSGAHADVPMLRPGELLAIVAFWGFIAALTAATRLLDPRIPTQSNVASALATLAVAEYAIWAVLTVPIVWLGSRVDLERGLRPGRVLLFLALGIVIALLVDGAVSALRAELLPFPRRRGGGGFGGPGGGFGGRGGGGGSNPFASFFRLGYLDDLMVYLAVLAGGVARGYFLRYQTRHAEAARLEAHAAHLQAQLAEARLAVLRAQLNPHFLFNTLNAVSALVKSDPRGVRRMIARLSELLRHSLEGTEEQELPLARELELLRLYVEIMEVRFQGRLDVDIRVDDALHDALVPTLVLQPLVENAMKHGVSAVEGSGRIVVRARRDTGGAGQAGTLVLSVEDDGPGPAGALTTGSLVDASVTGEHQVRGSGTGVGLSNTRARLEQLYGSAQQLTLRPRDGGGTVAELRIPYHTAEGLGARG